MATIKVPVVVLGLAAVLSTAPAAAQDMPFGAQAPLTADALAEHRGRYMQPDAVDLSATVTNNSVQYFGTAIDAANTIDGGALANASGVLTVVQNIGNNVVIQTGVAVTIQMVQPGL